MTATGLMTGLTDELMPQPRPTAPAQPLPTGSGVRVHTLGGFSLTVDGERVHRWRAGKARSLFQYLLLNRGQVVTREALHEALWPDTDLSPKSSSLRVATHAIRQILGCGPDAVAGGSAVRIAHRDFGYVLEAEGLWTDFEEFERLASAAAVAANRGDNDEARLLDERAMSLYRGDFLAGEQASWITEHREWTRAVALKCLDRLRSDATARRDHVAAIYWCRRELDIDPYHEGSFRTLMAVFGQLGERGRVRRWWDICVQRLRDDLDVEPALSTVRVYRTAMGLDRTTPPAAAARRPLPVRQRPLAAA
jgi:two-component SAPR family response regulator